MANQDSFDERGVCGFIYYSDQNTNNNELIILLDISGSMNEWSTDNDGNGATSFHIAVQSIKTIIETLLKKDPNLKITIKAFSNTVNTILPTCQVKQINKQRLFDTLENINPDGGTNIYAALCDAFWQARNSKNHINIILLTDGLPTKYDGDTCDAYTKIYNINTTTTNFSLHTFGLGPKIDSEFLLKLSNKYRGIFKYMSSLDMVGTCIIYSITMFLLNLYNQSNFEVPKELLTLLCIESLNDGRKLLETIKKCNHPVAEDWEQISIALSKQEYWDSWGKHFIRALISCHQHHHVGNFKDPGLATYSTKEFENLSAEILEIFKTIPPPKGTQIRSMDAYVNPYGGCIDINASFDVIIDGKIMKIPGSGLKAGDKVRSTNDKTATIKYILRHNNCPKQMVKISKLRNAYELRNLDEPLIITAWHPICVMSHERYTWKHPTHCEGAEIISISDRPNVMSIVLEEQGCYSVFANGVECCTLGHNQNWDPVLRHEFYGTNKVVKFIEKLLACGSSYHIINGIASYDYITEYLIKENREQNE